MKETFLKEGALNGQKLQNVSTWILAWALEMAWCWSRNELDKVQYW